MRGRYPEPWLSQIACANPAVTPVCEMYTLMLVGHDVALPVQLIQSKMQKIANIALNLKQSGRNLRLYNVLGQACST